MRLFTISETTGARTIDLEKIIEIHFTASCKNVRIVFVGGHVLRYDGFQCYADLLDAWRQHAAESQEIRIMQNTSVTAKLTKGAVKEIADAIKGAK